MTDTGAASEDGESYVDRPEELADRGRRLGVRIGQLMKVTRERASLGQAKVALRMGVRQPTIAGYEAGTGGVLQVHIIEAFEQAVGLEPGSMFDSLGLAPRGREISFETFIMSLEQLDTRQKKIFIDLWRVWVPDGGATN